MTPTDLTILLTERFGEQMVEKPSPDTWRIETEKFIFLAILLQDFQDLRLLLPLFSVAEATPYLTTLLEANFEQTRLVRYAINQGVVWGVFDHPLESLTTKDCQAAIAQLITLYQKGLSTAFNQMAEQQLRQIVQAAKSQGQTLEATLQNVTRLYEEGILGGLDQNAQEKKQFLTAWRSQLERLWQEESS
ncbi:MAG: hypothetical protein AB4041_20870 [Microcystaceae cyanobacterium]